MPTVVREDGFEVFFYANEHLPRHVHVKKAGKFAKVDIESMTVIRSTFGAPEQRQMLTIIRNHRDELWRAWDGYFSTR